MTDPTPKISLINRWLSLTVWMGLIYLISDQPRGTVPSFGVWDFLFKKGAHFLAYAILAWLAQRALIGVKRPTLWALVITAVYAISDEYHQTFVPGRHGQIMDVLIDCAGGVISLIMLRLKRGDWASQPPHHS